MTGTDDPVEMLAEERKAIDWIARSPEGRLLHRYLRRVLESAIDFQTESALRAHHGRRTLARDLMALMAEGIRSGGPEPGNDPVLARRSEPAERRPRGIARRVPLIDPFARDPDTSDAA